MPRDERSENPVQTDGQLFIFLVLLFATGYGAYISLRFDSTGYPQFTIP